MFERSEQTLRELDKIIVVCVFILVAAGLMAIYSVTTAINTPAVLKDNFAKQVIWFTISIMIASAVIMTPMKFFYKYAYWFYAVALILLILVLFWGAGRGSHRWFVLGLLRLQPSEIAKVATILAVAKFASHQTTDLRHYKDLIIVFAIALVPALLIVKEPDLGTAMVFFALAVPMLFWAGLSPFIIFVLSAPIITLISAFNLVTFTIAILLIIGILLWSRRRLWVVLTVFLINITVGILTPKVWEGMHDYQRQRILTFVGLQEDPKGSGYQVNQAKVAIGSGGFWGKGWQHGTQTKLRFLPEQHTDFIFTVIGEEFGFLGVTLIMVVFLTLLLRALMIAAAVKSKFTALVVVGSVTVISVHVIINMGMCVGIMPVTGLPLPFLSYGGSALWTNTILVSLILNAGVRRFEYL
ncbi:MAG: rod shape-determining protein RodA [candidate division KSB1 bacterium]|nr:rod shape-determining protein RodA [candidate division KSB1 bacterium]MDZ7303565.1 rod shape-determining protein RodA [candidate division KSB1 bacterium]MDZ7312808.1 rod shape-determining protein RodA [candidate division KSB1 bacterium]